MVNRQVVLDTVKKMYQSGIENSVIEKTLKDIGLSRKDIDAFMAEAKGTLSSTTVSESPVIQETNQSSEEIARKTAAKVKEHLDDQREEQELREITIHSAIEGHGEKLGELHEKVSELHEKIGGVSGRLTDPALLKQMAELSRTLSGFESQLSELKALANANKTILEKILETNRSILGKP